MKLTVVLAALLGLSHVRAIDPAGPFDTYKTDGAVEFDSAPISEEQTNDLQLRSGRAMKFIKVAAAAAAAGGATLAHTILEDEGPHLHREIGELCKTGVCPSDPKSHTFILAGDRIQTAYEAYKAKFCTKPQTTKGSPSAGEKRALGSSASNMLLDPHSATDMDLDADDTDTDTDSDGDTDMEADMDLDDDTESDSDTDSDDDWQMASESQGDSCQPAIGYTIDEGETRSVCFGFAISPKSCELAVKKYLKKNSAAAAKLAKGSRHTKSKAEVKKKKQVV